MHDADFEYIQGEFTYRYCGDLTTAKRRLAFVARRGHARAQHLLGTICQEQHNYRQAARWFRLSAWQGRLPAAAYDTNAICALAGLCAKPASYAWYKLAAVRKSSEAAEAHRELVRSMTADCRRLLRHRSALRNLPAGSVLRDAEGRLVSLSEKCPRTQVRQMIRHAPQPHGLRRRLVLQCCRDLHGRRERQRLLRRLVRQRRLRG